MKNNNKNQTRGVYVPSDLLGVFTVVQAVVLAQIMYWHRLTDAGERRYAGDKCQLSYDGLATQLNLTKNQVRTAVKALQAAGVVSCEFRTVELKDGRKVNNVMYISIVDDVLCNIYPEWAEIEHVASDAANQPPMPAEYESPYTEIPDNPDYWDDLGDFLRDEQQSDCV